MQWLVHLSANCCVCLSHHASLCHWLLSVWWKLVSQSDTFCRGACEMTWLQALGPHRITRMARIAWYQEKVMYQDTVPLLWVNGVSVLHGQIICVCCIFLMQIGAYDQQIWEKSLEQAELKVSKARSFEGWHWAEHCLLAYLKGSSLSCFFTYL